MLAHHRSSSDLLATSHDLRHAERREDDRNTLLHILLGVVACQRKAVEETIIASQCQLKHASSQAKDVPHE